MIRLTKFSIICDSDDDVGDYHHRHAVLESSLSIAQIDQKIGIHCRKRSASWLLVGLHYCWILRRTQCTMICRSEDGSTTTQLAGFWDDLVKSRQHRLQVDLSSISGLPLPSDNRVCGKLVIVFNPNWFFFWEWRKWNLSVASTSLGIAHKRRRIIAFVRWWELNCSSKIASLLIFTSSFQLKGGWISIHMTWRELL